MEEISQDVEHLRAFALKIRSDRKLSALIDDMYEAADDWADYGDLILKNSDRTDFPGRTRQEADHLESLIAYYGEDLTGNPEFATILAIGQRFIERGKRRKLNPDGYLSALRFIRESFSFLEQDFGFCLRDAQLTGAKYATDHLIIDLDLPTEHGSWCWIRTLDEKPDSFEIETLLFQAGHFETLVLPPGTTITTEAQVEAWFRKVAAIFREHGSDLLANKPGAIERLKAASIERDRLHVEECERLWRFEHPGEPLPTFPS